MWYFVCFSIYLDKIIILFNDLRCYEVVCYADIGLKLLTTAVYFFPIHNSYTLCINDDGKMRCTRLNIM